MSRVREAVLAALSDGRAHSGAELARELGVTRAAVARQVAVLRRHGWPITGRAGEGYWLADGAPLPLRRSALEDGLGAASARVARLDVLSAVESTSDYVIGAEPPSDGRACICIADHQTAGRGRRGRGWLARPGDSITFSVARYFVQGPGELAPLGLVAGLSVAEALAAAGVPGIGLKWPNDVVVGQAKLGGILVEVRGEADGPTRAVVGVGLNYSASDAAAFAGLGRPLSDVCTAMGSGAPARDALAGAVAGAVVHGCDVFARDGFAALRPRWQALDVLADRPVRVVTGASAGIAGRARGIDADGALRVDTDAGQRRFLSGDVSVRAGA